MDKLTDLLRHQGSFAIADWLKERQPDEVCRVLVDYLAGRLLTDAAIEAICEECQREQEKAE